MTCKKRVYVLAVVAGHCHVNPKKVILLFGGVGTQFANRETRIALTGCISSYRMPLHLQNRRPVIDDFEVLSRTDVRFDLGRLHHFVV